MLGSFVTREIVRRLNERAIPVNMIDRVIGANVATPLHAPNLGRVCSVRGGVPLRTPAYTIGDNCGSGIAALQVANLWIQNQEANCVLVVAAESMSRIPIAYSEALANLFKQLAKAKTVWEQGAILIRLYPRLLRFRKKENAPLIGLRLGLTDPLCDMPMPLTAERLAMDPSFGISREDQDDFAFWSHQKAAQARSRGVFAEEIIPVYVPGQKGNYAAVETDNGIREPLKLKREELAKLKPIFDPHGTVTAGNSSQITDGAAAMLVASEACAQKLGLPVMGSIIGYKDCGFDPSRMGLAPVAAIAEILRQTGLKFSDFQCIEINEAFAAQILAVLRTLDSDTLMKKWFGSYGYSERIGEIPDNVLNPNGGAIALGHPVGVSGVRLALTALKELQRRDQERALISACIGGGQGAAMILQRGGAS